MMRKFSVFFELIFAVVILFSFNSCEWDGSSDDNYVEIDKPQTINIGVDLSGLNPNEVIQIANGSSIRYTLSSEGKQLINQKFYLDGKELTSWSSNSVTINEPIVDDQVHELKLVMAFKTGTGSLAELLGVEYYVGEIDFKIRIFEQYTSRGLNIKQSLEKNKYLKLEWDKPENLIVEKYEVYDGWSNPNPIAVISDPNQNYFIDENYAYGYAHYVIKAIPANSINISTIEGSIYVEYNNFNQDNISSSINNTKITATWNNPNPYPAKYIVRISDDNIIEVKDGQNSLEFTRPHFPYSNNPRIYILPLNAKTEDYELYPYTYFHVSDKHVSEYSYHLQFWNKKTNSIVGFINENFFSHDLFYNLTLTQTGKLPNDVRYQYSWEYSSAPNGLIAIKGHSFINIFNGEEFSKETYKFENLSPTCFAISDEYLFYLDNYQDSFCVIDLTTKDIIDKKNVTEKFNLNKTLEVSSDGRYIVLYSSGLLESGAYYTIYEFKNNKLNELRHVEMQIASILFNPQDPSQIIIHDFSNQFHIIHVASNNVLQTVTDNSYLYADPYTDNILCYSSIKNSKSAYLSVYDKTLKTLLYRVETPQYLKNSKEDFIFANNIIFSNQTGALLDISESLKNK